MPASHTKYEVLNKYQILSLLLLLLSLSISPHNMQLAFSLPLFCLEIPNFDLYDKSCLQRFSIFRLKYLLCSIFYSYNLFAVLFLVFTYLLIFLYALNFFFSLLRLLLFDLSSFNDDLASHLLSM